MLFVKLGAIGDVVQAAAALMIYRERNPSVTVDWLVGSGQAELVRSFGVFENLIEVSEKKLFTGPLRQRLATLLQTNLSFLKHGKAYDNIVTAYVDIRYRLLTVMVMARQRSSFSRHAKRPSPIQHRSRVSEYLRLMAGEESIAAVDIAGATESLGRRVLAAPMADDSKHKLSSLPEHYIVLIPGGSKNILPTDGLRRWPISHYRALAESIRVHGYNVVLAGGHGDAWVIDDFEGIEYENWIGRTTLHEMVHLLERADAVITHDTGPLHLSCLTRTPVLALFGPTPANAVVPFGRPDTAIIQLGNEVSCSPCYDGRRYAQCDCPVCMENISVQRVEKTLMVLLSKRCDREKTGQDKYAREG
ncbi:MAG: glycosyltransferase family 9 protein [Chlorobaculum sp.]